MINSTIDSSFESQLQDSQEEENHYLLVSRDISAAAKIFWRTIGSIEKGSSRVRYPPP